MDLINLEVAICSAFNEGEDAVLEVVRKWLLSKGYRKDDFSDMVFVEKQYLGILLDSSKKLNALYDAGVDNWEGYDDVVEQSPFQ